LPPLPPPPESAAPPLAAPAAQTPKSTTPAPTVEYERPHPAPAASPEPDAVPVPPGRTWYGWQILAVDGGSLALILAGAGSQSTQFITDLGLLGYVAGGPTVHWAHGNVGKGFGSLGLRLGLPLGGLLLGVAMAGGSCGTGNSCDNAILDIVLGFGIGFIAAPIIDVAALAYDDAPPKTPSATLRAPALRLAPTATLPRDAAGRMTPSLGLAGAF
jgi:hypothetical protein